MIGRMDRFDLVEGAADAAIADYAAEVRARAFPKEEHAFADVLAKGTKS